MTPLTFLGATKIQDQIPNLNLMQNRNTALCIFLLCYSEVACCGAVGSSALSVIIQVHKKHNIQIFSVCVNWEETAIFTM